MKRERQKIQAHFRFQGVERVERVYRKNACAFQNPERSTRSTRWREKEGLKTKM